MADDVRRRMAQRDNGAWLRERGWMILPMLERGLWVWFKDGVFGHEFFVTCYQERNG